MGILLYHFPGEHKLLMKHKVLLDGKYTAIDRVGTMKHIGTISKHEYLYRTYTLVVDMLTIFFTFPTGLPPPPCPLHKNGI